MAVVLALLVFCLSSSNGLVQGEDTLNVTVRMTTDDEAVYLNKSQYCFVDANTIKIDRNKTVGNIINVTEETIIAVNDDNTIIMIAPANGAWCVENRSEDDYFTIKLYVVQVIILVCILIAAISNIILHLLYKDLRTVVGILVMILCTSVTLAGVILIGKTTYKIVHGANENIVPCVVFLYALMLLLFIYQATKLTILYHFVNLMYQNYKMRLAQADDDAKHCLVKYISFILVSSILCFLSVAMTDYIINREMFTVKERYCIFHTAQFSGIYDKLFHGEMAVFTFLEITLSIAGFIFYFLVSKSCFQKKSTNIKVTIALLTVVGINIIINVILGILECSMNVILPAVTSGTLVEQIILLALFSSSSKVYTNCCIHV